jgi:hypothetical protein
MIGIIVIIIRREESKPELCTVVGRDRVLVIVEEGVGVVCLFFYIGTLPWQPVAFFGDMMWWLVGLFTLAVSGGRCSCDRLGVL